ncbi:ATP-dependent nuclease [Dehalococcoides mccartyi]|jgi:putative ATP-dependent endonuclease of OLD family|uniref:ATP-dependent nuclease n=1 Tax=Dehalococcoides mccartyi TaxID=61435 RepID=UPI0004E04413|nr:AAA family ATPase [Dehalococcoides mccartyi]AII57414.1 nucleoside triphosphate hydrolase [Dehalococcoides mccartyi CG1]
MFLSRIEINNFRNFEHLDVKLGRTTVVVGENNVGKSNLLHALRLILDPKLPDAARQLKEEDFWDGLKQPVTNKLALEIAVEFQDFQEDKSILAVLQSYLVKGVIPDTARLTYRFRPRSPLPKGRDVTIEDYEFVVFGGVDEKNRVGYDVRRWMPIELLPALRDAESDLSAWRDSPLRPLIERLQIPPAKLDTVAGSIDQATNELMKEKDVQTLIASIESRLVKMIGGVISVGPSLGFTPTNPDRLLRSLRMFGDGTSKRNVSDLSLGINNILYLLLLSLELERKEATSERATTILAIEEPEAHLHPHLQRLVFRDFLRRKSPVLLTTHSPPVASVAPLPSILLLKQDQNKKSSVGSSALEAKLSEQDVIDLERYLDATRAEILFAKGIILVEGASEMFLLPAFASRFGTPLDEHGITVCSVHGTDFGPYIKLLGSGGLNLPFVVVTDGDWFESTKGETISRGFRRAIEIVKTAGYPESPTLEALYKSRKWPEINKIVSERGVFVGKRTLEVDLFNVGYQPELTSTFVELGASLQMLERAKELAGMKAPMTAEAEEQLLSDIERIGKGRFAQRFAAKVDEKRCPDYIKASLAQIVKVLS